MHPRCSTKCPHRKTTKQCINGVPAKIKAGTCEPAEATKIQDGERAQRDREIKRQRDALIQGGGWGGVGKKQGTPRKGYIPCGDAKAREGEGSERERRGGEERRVWRAEREEWGFGNRKAGRGRRAGARC